MDLAFILKSKYPDINITEDVILMDNGKGPYIASWNYPDAPSPTYGDIEVWANTFKNDWEIVQAKRLNAPLYAQLKEIDDKSIRALREGDSARLQLLNQEADSLRAQLVKPNTGGS